VNNYARRAFLLSITLTELALLMFFLLLLLSLKQVSDLRIENECLVDSLQNYDSGLEKIREAISSVSDDTSDFFILSLISEVGQNQSLETQRESLLQQVDSLTAEMASLNKENKTLTKQLERVRSRSNAADQVLSLTDSLSAQQREVENLRGRIVYMQNREGGPGFGPCVPCWLSSDGKAEYIYDVIIYEDRIEVQATWPEHRRAEAASVPNVDQLIADSLSVALFHKLAAPILEFSKVHNCRYFVRIEDRAVSKRAFKVRLNAIEGYFCKFLVNPTRDIKVNG